jgi:hypothetical protein
VASAPDTVTEAIAFLEAEGYSEEFDLDTRTLMCPACGQASSLAGAHVDHMFRFEGDSDPADEMIVLGLSCPACRRRGILVSAYGPAADREHAEALRTLAANRASW